jgi:predicted peptidase
MSHAFPDIPGLHDRDIGLASGASVRCTLVVPPGTRAGGAPLVLCLHYGGEPVGYYGRALLEHLLEPAWRALGAVFVAPVAVGGDWQTDTNTDRVLALLEEVGTHYGCAATRRIVTGYSLGAIGTWHLLARAPTLFAAAVPMAGPPPLAVAGRTPVRALNSTADTLFPAATTARAVDALGNAGRDARCELIDGVDHYSFAGFAPAVAGLVPWLSALLGAD